MSRKAGVISIDVTAGTAKMIVDLDRGKAALREFGASGRSSMAPTSAALKELEGNITNNNRAVARFLADTLKLGPAIATAFPLFGGIALAGMLGSLSEKVVDFFKKMAEGPEKMKIAFDDLNGPLRSANDELRVVGDRLEIDIAKLEHRAPNMLKLSLDETAKSADDLGRALEKDLESVSKLLKEHKTGWIAENLFGKAGTDDLEKFNKQLSQQAHDEDEKLRTATRAARGMADSGAAKATEDAAIKARNDAVAKLYRDAESHVTGIINAPPQKGMYLGDGVYTQPDPSQRANRVAAANAMRENYQDEQDRIKQTSKNSGLQEIKNTDEAASEAEKKREEAHKKWMAFLRDADRVQKEAAHQRDEEFKKQEEGVAKLGEEAALSEEKFKKLFAEDHFKLPGAIANQDTTPNRLSGFQSLAEQLEGMRHTEQMDLIGVRDPKVIAEKELNARLAVIEAVRKREIALLVDEHKIREQNDKARLDATEARDRHEERMAELRKQQADQLTGPLINGISGEIANAATGQKTNFGRTFQNAGHQIIQQQLEKGLHGLVDKFLLPQKQQHVIVDNWPAVAPQAGSQGVANGALSQLAGLPGPFGWVGKLIGGAAKAMSLPMLAEGGDVDPGHSYGVADGGEFEVFTPRTAGTVTPAHKLGGGSTVYNVDARSADLGAHNRISRALEITHRSAVATAVRANDERAKRTPRRST